MVSTSNNWQNYTVKKLDFPYRKYLLYSCLKTDEGYIITGDTGSYVYSPAFVALFDFDFNIKWLKVYPFQCRYTSVLKTNYGYLIAGEKGFEGQQRITHAGIDNNGNILWQNDYTDTSKYYFSGYLNNGVKINNYYYNYGFTSNYQKATATFAYLNVSDENGNMKFEKIYDKYQSYEFRKMITYKNALYATADVDTFVNDTMSRLVQFSKISPENGVIEWYHLYKHYFLYNEVHNFYKIDNGFLFCGVSVNQNRIKEFDSTGTIEGDAWLLKVDTNGCIIPGCKPNVYGGIEHILNDNSQLEVYPNPAKESFTISFKNQSLFNSSNEIYIFDALGKELYYQNLKANQTNITIQNTFNYSGAAFLVIKNNKGTFYKKMILL